MQLETAVHVRDSLSDSEIPKPAGPPIVHSPCKLHPAGTNYEETVFSRDQSGRRQGTSDNPACELTSRLSTNR